MSRVRGRPERQRRGLPARPQAGSRRQALCGARGSCSRATSRGSRRRPLPLARGSRVPERVVTPPSRGRPEGSALRRPGHGACGALGRWAAGQAARTWPTLIRAGGVLRGRGRASWLGPSGGFPAQLRGGLAARPTARGSDRRCAPRSLRPGRGAETALLGAAPSPRGDARERSVTAASEGAVGAQQRRRPSSVASPQPLGRGAWRPSWQSPAPRLVCSGRCRAAPPGTAVRGGAAGNWGAPDPGRTDGDAGAEKRVLASPARALEVWP